jgi:hypothetical protein
MDEEYKAHITDLEVKERATPLKQCKARIEELKGASATIPLCLEDT